MKKTVLAMIMVAVMPTLAGCASHSETMHAADVCSRNLGGLLTLPLCVVAYLDRYKGQ